MDGWKYFLKAIHRIFHFSFPLFSLSPITMTYTMLYTRFKMANNDAVNVMIGRNPERRNLAI